MATSHEMHGAKRPRPYRTDPPFGKAAPRGLARLPAAEARTVVSEELLTHVTTITGERPKALIRADIVYFKTIAGGAVF